jgi:hypothetical protein
MLPTEPQNLEVSHPALLINGKLIINEVENKPIKTNFFIRLNN